MGRRKSRNWWFVSFNSFFFNFLKKKCIGDVEFIKIKFELFLWFWKESIFCFEMMVGLLLFSSHQSYSLVCYRKKDNKFPDQRPHTHSNGWINSNFASVFSLLNYHHHHFHFQPPSLPPWNTTLFHREAHLSPLSSCCRNRSWSHQPRRYPHPYQEKEQIRNGEPNNMVTKARTSWPYRRRINHSSIKHFIGLQANCFIITKVQHYQPDWGSGNHEHPGWRPEEARCHL